MMDLHCTTSVINKRIMNKPSIEYKVYNDFSPKPLYCTLVSSHWNECVKSYLQTLSDFHYSNDVDDYNDILISYHSD